MAINMKTNNMNKQNISTNKALVAKPTSQTNELKALNSNTQVASRNTSQKDIQKINPRAELQTDASKHPSQRVAIFVDVQNMYYSGKNLFNRKVNFGLLLKKAVNNRQLVRALAYAIKADMPEEQTFRDALKNVGYEVKIKELQTFYGGHKKGDWDVGIAMDTIRIAPKVDTIVLVSGDGDFADLVVYLQGLGCRVEVIGFEKTTSSRLLDVADDFTAIERKYLI
jgi:uncharacterized LabA/DUF88 family protein